MLQLFVVVLISTAHCDKLLQNSPADIATLLDLTITVATSCNGLALLLRDVGVGRLAEGDEGTFETFGANSLLYSVMRKSALNGRKPKLNPQINSFSNSW